MLRLILPATKKKKLISKWLPVHLLEIDFGALWLSVGFQQQLCLPVIRSAKCWPLVGMAAWCCSSLLFWHHLCSQEATLSLQYHPLSPQELVVFKMIFDRNILCMCVESRMETFPGQSWGCTCWQGLPKQSAPRTICITYVHSVLWANSEVFTFVSFFSPQCSV